MSATSETRTVTAFEFRDYGVDHAQYFQGTGIAFTDWDDVYVGVGDTAREAAEDALESLCSSADSVTGFIGSMEDDLGDFDATTSAHDDCTCECEPGNDLNECLGDCHDDCKLNHYVALYVRYADSESTACIAGDCHNGRPCDGACDHRDCE